ncbi:NB-ARC domain-containing protein [Nostoc sp. DSM 114167]|jgi:DNA-binding CsgD family transcriptional regulator|uniref:NB-ARC domain-containing protein n=1 Tax=Nostoc sp. DSM 114167 TaxID=3439050 RepID=UPI0040458C6B
MDENEFTKKVQELTPKPREVLMLVLQSYTDKQISEKIDASIATVRKHIQNLCDRFEIQREVNGIKRNRRGDLIALVARYKPEWVSDSFSALTNNFIRADTDFTQANTIPYMSQNGAEERPDVSVFYGRQEELNKLKQWIIENKSQVVAIWGMAGIGKSLLAAKLVHEIEGKFDYIIWRSLWDAPTFDKFNEDLRFFKDYRCLLVLDNWDTILKKGDFAGQYEEKYKEYGELLKQLGKEHQQSCLVITSREKPREIALLEEETLSVRSLLLEGLKYADAKAILEAKELSGEQRWKTLIHLYRGNPLALKIISTMIKELFGGDVSAFIEQSLSAVILDISDLIQKQFERLTDLEKDIMYWLAIEQDSIFKDNIPYLQAIAEKSESVSLTKLQNASLLVSPSDFLNALNSLAKRDLIEKGKATYTLQPAVWEYVKNRFIEEVCQEIQTFNKTHKLKLLKSHALKKSLDKNLKEAHTNHILNLIQNRLYLKGNFQESLDAIKEMVQGRSQLEVGYVAENIENILTVFQ